MSAVSVTPAADAASLRATRQERKRDSPLQTLMVAATLALIVVAILLPAQLRDGTYSPLDEATHLGYTWSVGHGDLPARGDTLPQAILDEWSCVGQTNVTLPECGIEHPPADFPAGGQNYNFGHPPLYYAINGIVARGLSAVFPHHSFITLARTTSMAWVWAGVLLLYLALRRWSVSVLLASSAAALVVTTPWVVHAGVAVTNDAPAVLCGAAALWLLARVVVDRRTDPWVPALVAALVAATKVLNALPIIATALALLIFAVVRRRDYPWRRLIGIATAMLGGVAVIYVGWSVFQAMRGAADWTNPIEGVSNRPIVGTPVGEWLSTAFSGFNPMRAAGLSGTLGGATANAWSAVLQVFLISAPWVALFVLRARDPRQVVPWSALAALAIYPMLIEVQVFVSSKGTMFFPFISTRYAIAAIPLVVGCGAVALSRRRTAIPAAAVAGVGVLLTVAGTTGLS